MWEISSHTAPTRPTHTEERDMDRDVLKTAIELFKLAFNKELCSRINSIDVIIDCRTPEKITEEGEG